MIEAEAGDSLLEVSYNAGCPIPTGCGCGSCGTCEVRTCISISSVYAGAARPRPHSSDAWDFSAAVVQVEMTVSGGAQQGKQVVRACNTMLPRGASGIAVSFLKDELWGDPGSVPPGAAINDDGYPPPPTTPDQQQ